MPFFRTMHSEDFPSLFIWIVIVCLLIVFSSYPLSLLFLLLDIVVRTFVCVLRAFLFFFLPKLFIAVSFLYSLY